MNAHVLFIYNPNKVELTTLKNVESVFVRALPDELNHWSGPEGQFTVDEVTTEYVGAAENMPKDVDLHVRIEATFNDGLEARQEEAEQSIHDMYAGCFAGMDLRITTQLRLPINI